MATEIKTVTKTVSDEERGSLQLRFRRGDVQGAIGAAALRARKSGAAWYVYATHAGYQVDPNEPPFPKGGRFYKITMVGNTITGVLFEH
jgi:hypothetical protein